MNNYILELFEEYKNAKGFKDNIKIKNYEKGFKEWCENKKNILNYYNGMLESMDLISSRGVVEFDKGIHDSVIPHLSEEGKGIAVSNYYTTFKKTIVSVPGNIVVMNNKPVLYTKDELIELDNYFNYYISQLPSNKETINTLGSLVSECNEKVYIGIMGNNRDIDFKQKVNKLYNLKKELQTFTGKNFEGDVVFTDENFVGAITPKYKILKFNKKYTK